MLFNSYVFIFCFLPIAVTGFFLLGRVNHRLAAAWLGAASLFFYGWWDARFVSLLIGSVVFNYVIGYLLGRARFLNNGRKMLLGCAIGTDLVLLGYFKYSNFFISSVSNLLGMDIATAKVILPLGISFFTFTQIAFLVDAYRGQAREYNFLHYLLFVTYFPHLIAGPVLHHGQMMPQFGENRTYRFDVDNFAVGLTVFVIGLAKKVLVADTLADFATPVFAFAAVGTAPMFVDAWVGALAYTLQLYFDFSGYSDMAIGLSLLFNVRLPINFDSPYKARNIIEFWRRWHITLSNFLRDYLYFPIGGNRQGKRRRYINLMITMLLGGLWHGAAWTFVAWGGLHGLYLVLNHGWQALRPRLRFHVPMSEQIEAVLATGSTFLAVVVGWVFFRAESFSAARNILRGMMGLNGLSFPRAFAPAQELQVASFREMGVIFEGVIRTSALGADRAAAMIVLGCAIVWLMPNVQQLMHRYHPAWEAAPNGREAGRLRWEPSVRNAWILGLVAAATLLSMTSVSEFLYYQF